MHDSVDLDAKTAFNWSSITFYLDVIRNRKQKKNALHNLCLINSHFAFHDWKMSIYNEKMRQSFDIGNL